MRAVGERDPAGLGRRAFARRLPVLGQAPERPPQARPFEVADGPGPTRFLLRVLTSAKRLTLPAVVPAMVWQAGEALVPIVAGVAIDRALATGDAGQLVLWLGVLAVVFGALSLGYRFTALLVARATENVQHRLRVTLSRAVLHADAPGPPPDGGVVSLLTNDVTRAAMVGLTVFPIAELFGVAFIAIALLVLDWPLGLAVLAGAPLTVFVMGRLSGRLAEAGRAYQTVLAATVGRATDLIAGYRVIKGMRAETEAARRYDEASSRALASALTNASVLGRFLSGSGTVSGVFVAGVAAAAGWSAVAGRLSIGELITAVGLAQALLPPMQMMAGNAVPSWAAALASSGRILDALRSSAGPDVPAAPDTATTHIPVVRVGSGVHAVVRVEPGEMVALRGDDVDTARFVDALLHPSGANGLRLTLDDETPDPGTYRAQVVVSPHHAALFSGTVADTVTGTAGLRSSALRTAACEDFVHGADDLDAQVGEMGTTLSGGQRQRLALARALAGDPPVLVLHDPTTAVDSVTEQVIAEQLRAMRAGRTTLLVCSSPALLNVCDRVVDLPARHD